MINHDRIVEVCQLLKEELLDRGYVYGFYLDNKRIVPNTSLGFDEEFARLLLTEYRIQSPELTKREKVATCLDAVLIMRNILDKQNIGNRIWMTYQKEKNKVHSILTFNLLGKIVYLELTPQSSKPNYGKEILFENEEEFTEYWNKQGYTLQDITSLCNPGANPTFFKDMLK